MPFSNTTYYKKSLDSNNREKDYWLISPFEDGNCGLYAFCCGLIDIIITDRLILDDKKFEAFKSTILENILSVNWKTEPPYVDELIPDILKFLECIHQPGFSFFQFKNFLSEQTHRGIAAIALILAYPLRIIGVRKYLNMLNNESGNLLEEDQKLLENNSWIGEETLSPLANYFGISIQLISHDNNCESPLPENTTPFFSLVKQHAHWNYLLPMGQTDGLAKILPRSENNPHPSQGTKSKELLEENQRLLQELEKKFVNTLVVFCEDGLKKLSNTLKNIFHKLKNIFSCELNSSLEFEHATQQASIASKNSTEILNLLRKTWDKSAELDSYLNHLGLKQIEKTLIKKPFIVDNSKDAALASILQNAEISDFLYRNYTALTNFYSAASCQTNVASKVITLPTKPPNNLYVKVHDQRNADLYISRSI